MWKYDKSLNQTDWARVTFLDRVYKLHCDGRDRAGTHGMANLHSCDGTINAESYIRSFRATLADKYHKRFKTVEQVVHQTIEEKNSIQNTSVITD